MLVMVQIILQDLQPLNIYEGVTCCYQGHENFHENADVVTLWMFPGFSVKTVLQCCYHSLLFHAPCNTASLPNFEGNSTERSWSGIIPEM